MARPDPRKLKDEAAGYVTRGKWAKALENYLILEKLEPADGTWAQRAGEMLRRLGRAPEAVAPLTRAAAIYSRVGFLLKAVAVNKLILEIDPRRTDVQAELVSLHAARLHPRLGTIVAAAVPPPLLNAPPPPLPLPLPLPPPPLAVPAPPPAALVPTPPIAAPSPRAAPVIGPAPTALQPVPLEDLAFNRVVPGARKSDRIAAIGDSAAYEIPLGDDDIEVVEDEIDVEGPTPADQAQLLLPRTPLFSSLDEERLRTLIDRTELRRLGAGEVLFHRGDPADGLYVVAAGEVVVLAPAAGGGEIEVARLREGAFFGEIALLTSGPRGATIQASVDTDLLFVARPVMAELVADAPEVLQVLLRFMRDRLIDTLIETNPLFAPFSGADRRALAARFLFLEVDRGVSILVQGKRAPGLFIVLAGVAELVVDGHVLGELAPGNIIGESSLLSAAPSAASVQAGSKLLLLELPRADFQEVIMTHPQVLEYIGALADERGRQLEELRADAFADGRLRVV